MLRFVIVSSNKENKERLENIINKAMISNDIYYENHYFSALNENFNLFCEQNYSTFVFIIDEINFPVLKLLENIKIVHKLYSAFIIVINHNNNITYNEPFLLNTICDINYEEKLISNIKYIINVTHDKKEAFSFTYNNILYRIPYNDILYFEKELNSKKCKIVCKKETYIIYKSLTEIQKFLDERFIKSHQSTIINKENIKSIDFDNSVIIFSYNNSCNLISRGYKKHLKTAIQNKY